MAVNDESALSLAWDGVFFLQRINHTNALHEGHPAPDGRF